MCMCMWRVACRVQRATCTATYNLQVEFALPQRPARSLPADKPKSLADIAVSLTATTPDAVKAAE